MPKAIKPRPWYADAFRWIAVLSASGVIGIAVYVGRSAERLDRVIEDVASLKIFSDLDKRIAVLEERTKGSNASAPLPALTTPKPTAGKQR